MHELSLAFEVCRMAEAQVGQDAVAQVVTVALEVGDDAGVEINNLQFCLEALLTEPPFNNAQPVIHVCRGDVLRLAYLEVDDDRPDN
jgi:Zn finger protein HypA/HybF involved in hydrogenase expression